MKGFWVTFTDGTQGYCEGESEYDAARIAEHFRPGKKVGGGPYQDFTMKTLPYPASPVIWQNDHPIHGKCPPFCYRPEDCAGRASCPRDPSCTN